MLDRSMKILCQMSDIQSLESINYNEIERSEKLKSSLLKLARSNGLFYYCMETLIKFDVSFSNIQIAEWNSECHRMHLLENTIDFLNKIHNKYNLNYMLIKACTKIPHVPRDVDIFVEGINRDAVFKILKDEGFEIAYSNPVETAFTKNSILKLDIYCEIKYMGIKFLDESFLWDSIIMGQINNINCYSLSDNANFLILLVHSFFGHRRITFLDFLHLKAMLSTIDEGLCREQAAKMGWQIIFDILLAKIKEINASIYSDGRVVLFPYLFERRLIFQCLDSIESFSIDKTTRLYIETSLFLDHFQHEIAKTPIYDYLLAFSPGRKCYNSFCYFIRNHRGDRHGIYK